MIKGHIDLLIGLARSGKSTYANQWIQDKIQSGVKAIVANSDSLRLTISGKRYLRSAEPVVHMVNYYIIKDFYNRGYHVLVDETNTTIGSIHQWLEIDPDLEFIYVDTPVKECEKRAILTGQNDLVDKGVIKRHYNNIEKLVWDHLPDSPINHENVMFALETIQHFYKRKLAGK